MMMTTLEGYAMRRLLYTVLMALLVLALAACAGRATPGPTGVPASPAPSAQPLGPQEFNPPPIIAASTDVTGVGTFVAAQAFALAGEEEIQALILPYGISPNSDLQDIAALEVPEPLVEGYAFAWSLSTPEGSQAILGESGDVAYFLADVEGTFALTLKATDEEGLSAETTWHITAATYVGNGAIVGDAAPPNCISCHNTQTAKWAETGHAMMFQEGIDGEASEHYGPNCIYCHTTGFNNWPTAVNGGFDDLAADSTWLFPQQLQEGNWQAMLQQYPDLAAMTAVQCESCHGPGSAHYTGDVMQPGPISVSLAVATCAQCHDNGEYYTFPREWALSAHADASAMAFTYSHIVGNSTCAGCHSGEGYIDRAKGLDELRADYQVITCAVCHDPHDATNPAQLRVAGTVILPGGIESPDLGKAATCASCHQSRTNASEVENASPEWPHYSTAAELMSNTGGYTWGETIDNSPHGSIVAETCITCHMAQTPGMDDMGTPDDSSDDVPLPGHDTVGEHTFAMVSPVDGTENFAVCTACHPGVTSFDWTARADYDGDGIIETNHEEIGGLRALLKSALEAKGVQFLASYPYYVLPTNASIDIKGGVWNYQFTGSGGSVVHNFKHTLGLLQLSLEKLGQ
jgi:cytochrome c1